jgi:broad specificity phosphatase PhoE
VADNSRLKRGPGKGVAITRVVLVRHGATEWNADKRAQGQADIALSNEGRSQARETAERLADLEIDAVYSSDLSRAVETAQAIAGRYGLDVEVDPAFREIDQGEWTGLPVAEIQQRWPELWGAARHYSARPGGESPREVRRRALEGLKRVVERHPHGTVVIASHGGTIRWLSAEVLGYDDRASARLRGLSNGGVVSFEARLDSHGLVLADLERMDGATPDTEDPNA